MPRDPLEPPHDWRCDRCGHVRSERTKPRYCFQCLDATFSPLTAANSRERLELELRLKSPKRADAGKQPAGQRDVNHLPLFIAANEPGLL